MSQKVVSFAGVVGEWMEWQNVVFQSGSGLLDYLRENGFRGIFQEPDQPEIAHKGREVEVEDEDEQYLINPEDYS